MRGTQITLNNQKALLITENQEYIAAIKHILEEHKITVHLQKEWQSAVSTLEPYGYCFIDSARLEALDLQQFSYVRYLIVMTSEATVDQVRTWMIKGARDVIVLPEESHRVYQLLRDTARPTTQDELAHSPFAQHRKVLSFFSSKGGSGTSIISALFAQTLQTVMNKRVILIDLNVQFGGQEVLFGVEPTRSYFNLEPVIKELSINHIQNVVHKDEVTGIDILLGPAQADMLERVSQELIINVLRVCKSHYDYVIVDLPSSFNKVSYTGLIEADEIYYLLTPDSLSVRHFKHAMKLFEQYQLLNRGQLRLLMNRKDKKSELTEKDLQKLIHQKILGTIRSDYYGLQPYLNMGKIMFEKKKPKNAVAGDVKALVERLLK